MTYAVPASKASIKQNQFEFTMPGSTKKYTVPKLKYLKPAMIIKIEESTEVAAAKLIFDTYLPEAFEQFEDAEQIEAFIAAWGEASGISLGESEASTDS